MKYQKLIVNHLIKSYYLLNVGKTCFENSSQVETVGLTDAIKITDLDDLHFKLKELKDKGYNILADCLCKK